LAEALPKRLTASDCGSRLGSAQLRHRGRGLWSRSEYHFNVTFATSGAFTYSYDYGLDVKEASIDPARGEATYRKNESGIRLNQPSEAALFVLEQMEQDLAKLERQMKISPLRNEKDAETIACLHTKIQIFRNTINEARRR
jgi:hypothetical protein